MALFPINHYLLKNGLKVITSEDHSLPVVSVVVGYKVGSLNEKPGKTGLAYLLENLMFLGSENVGRMKHISFIQRIGGNLNAITAEDKTIFSQTVPSNQLALILWLESDRMRSLNIEADAVESIKSDLIEEIRRRRETEPYFESSIYFDHLLFPDFSYSHPVMGVEEDLRKVSHEDVKDFYSTYYIPNNSVLCITGDIDNQKTKELVIKYFEGIPRKDQPLPLPNPGFEDKESKFEEIKDLLAPSPGFYLGYRIGSLSSSDQYALSIIEYILLRGRSSRLLRKLIKKEKTALQISGGIEKKGNLAAFKIFVTATNEFLIEKNQKIIVSEIEKLKTSMVGENELQRAKNMFKADFFNQFKTTLEKALFLTEAYLSGKNLDSLPEYFERHMFVSQMEIISAANKCFSQGRKILNIKLK